MGGWWWWKDESLRCGYLENKLCIKTAQVAQDRLLGAKAGKRAAGEFVTETREERESKRERAGE